MFVRFRQFRHRLHVSIVVTRRVGGRVQHQYVVGLRSIVMPPSVSDRIAFWWRVNKRLAKLSNRIDADWQGRLQDEIRKRIPMVTPEEQRGWQAGAAVASAKVAAATEKTDHVREAEYVDGGLGKPVDTETLLRVMGCTKQDFESSSTLYQVQQVVGPVRATV